MSREFARAFYHSPAWLRNRSSYLDVNVDVDGHVVMPSDDGYFYWTDEYGNPCRVDESNVVPPYMCERCFKQGKLVAAKMVHHIIHLDPHNINDPHVTLSYDNFMRLCQDCHAAVHANESVSRVTFDANGCVVWDNDDPLAQALM